MSVCVYVSLCLRARKLTCVLVCMYNPTEQILVGLFKSRRDCIMDQFPKTMAYELDT